MLVGFSFFYKSKESFFDIYCLNIEKFQIIGKINETKDSSAYGHIMSSIGDERGSAHA
jgi:hypothetical protein